MLSRVWLDIATPTSQELLLSFLTQFIRIADHCVVMETGAITLKVLENKSMGSVADLHHDNLTRGQK